jgi:hypothetical protein
VPIRAEDAGAETLDEDVTARASPAGQNQDYQGHSTTHYG